MSSELDVDIPHGCCAHMQQKLYDHLSIWPLSDLVMDYVTVRVGDQVNGEYVEMFVHMTDDPNKYPTRADTPPSSEFAMDEFEIDSTSCWFWAKIGNDTFLCCHFATNGQGPYSFLICRNIQLATRAKTAGSVFIETVFKPCYLSYRNVAIGINALTPLATGSHNNSVSL
jgi:hypothetical protein